MKRLILTAIAALLVASIPALGQSPVPDPDSVSHPVQQGDPALKTMPPRLDYVEDRRRITAEELPDQVRQTLETNEQYSGWQEANIFHDRNKDEYVVEFTEAGNTVTYRFDKEGRAIIKEDE